MTDDKIAGAHAECLDSLHWGAGGKARQEADPRSVLVRRGQTLLLQTRDNLPIYLSLDDAEEAVTVINALVARVQSVAFPPPGGG